MATAAMQDQWRLLDVQAHDTKLAQLAHRQRTLPEHARVVELEKRLAELDDKRVGAQTLAGDIAREVAKAEADVEQVRQRARRNQARMDSGQGNAKDMQALQHEVESLAVRQSVLEDAELEVMERQERIEATVVAVVAERDAVDTELTAARSALAAQIEAITSEVEAENAARANAAAGLPAELIALYEKIRAQSNGMGAAMLHQRQCQGCRLQMTPVDIQKLRDAPENEIVRCEECRRILVRTGESGL